MAALEDAIRAHVEDESASDARIVTDWFVIAAHVGSRERETRYAVAHTDASPHVMVGLVDYGADLYARSLDEEDDL
jgi:hypothetical protein